MEQDATTNRHLRHNVTHRLPLSVRKLPFQTADALMAKLDERRLRRARPEVADALSRSFDDRDLRAVYDQYVTDISSWEWAVAWRTARALDALCDAVKPRRILDLGSGFSTYVECNWARRNGAEVEIVSVDDSPAWLDTTRVFLSDHGLSARLIEADALGSLPAGSFDLAFDDMGRIEHRAPVIDTIVRVMAPGGVVVLDDMNVRGYRAEVRAKLAGIADFVPFLEGSDESWEQQIGIDLRGTWLALQEAARQMVKEGHGGAMVVVSSTNAFQPEQEGVFYNVSKSGQVAVMQTAAMELGKYGIRVNAIAPGIINTRLAWFVIKDPVQSKVFLDRTPIGRFAEPIEIAKPILFMCSDDASYMTGALMVVDGAYSVGLPVPNQLAEPLVPDAVR